MVKKTSFVVYRGPSMLDGAPIRGILTRGSTNSKTGDMAQLHIVRDDIAPHEATKTGADVSVCGECPQRPANGGGCYVTVFQGPRSAWQASNGRGVDLDAAVTFLQGKAAASTRRAVLRLGAYGDPAALPESVVGALCAAVDGRATGYTHQWRRADCAWVKAYCMASTENVRDTLIAWNRGWRTFRVGAPGMVNTPGKEITCVNTTRGTDCADCGLCFGALVAKSITIEVHGAKAKRGASKCEES